jgi:hypothetical protein
MGRTACTEPQCLYKGALYLTFYGGGGENNTLEHENGNTEEILHVTNMKHYNEANNAIHNYAMCNYKPLDDTN